MTAQYIQTIKTISVHLASESPIFGESVVEVSIDDEAAGPFIVLTQPGTASLKLDYEQLLLVVDAAKMLIDGAERCEGGEKP